VDRRVSRVALTAAGTALLEAVFPAHVERVVDAFSALDADELQTLSALLRRLGHGAASDTRHAAARRATGAAALTPVQEDTP
jgi:predicted dinucleotide-binding enzyme